MNDERFEGLNLPQLMELLHPVVYPETVSWLPQTTGWTVLGIWLLLSLLLIGIETLRRYRANAYRREALAILTAIDPFTPDARQQLSSLVKQTALAIYSRDTVASLSGDEWQNFLLQSVAPGRLSRSEAQTLSRAAYDPEIDSTSLKSAARKWIACHHA